MEINNYIKLSDLGKRIEKLFEDNFSTALWVMGEVSGHRYYDSQLRHYFDLVEKSPDVKEAIVKISAVAWRPGSQDIKRFEQETGVVFTNGIQVLLLVRLEYKAAYGLKLIVEKIDANFTLGNLEKSRRETLQRLLREYPAVIQQRGDEYFTSNKSLSFGKVIQKIALVTSVNSDAYHDFQHTLLNNQYNYCFSVDVYASMVQGVDAEKELVKCLVSIYKSEKKYDAVVITRGGGTKTDFQVFDSFKLSLAVAKFPIPIITGLGHHKDESIVDLMANSVTKTPTKAAEFIISHTRNFEENILQLQKRIVIKTQQILAGRRKELSHIHLAFTSTSKGYTSEMKDRLREVQQQLLSQSRLIILNSNRTLINQIALISSRPKNNLNKKNMEVQYLNSNIISAGRRYFLNQKGFLAHYESTMKILSPENILKRGFALLFKADKIVVDPSDLVIGKDISIQLKNERINTVVISKEKNKY